MYIHIYDTTYHTYLKGKSDLCGTVDTRVPCISPNTSAQMDTFPLPASVADDPARHHADTHDHDNKAKQGSTVPIPKAFHPLHNIHKFTKPFLLRDITITSQKFFHTMKSVAILSIVASILTTSAVAFAPPSAVLSTASQRVALRQHQCLKMMDDDEVSGSRWVLVPMGCGRALVHFSHTRFFRSFFLLLT
jgi:hypothetical protein